MSTRSDTLKNKTAALNAHYNSQHYLGMSITGLIRKASVVAFPFSGDELTRNKYNAKTLIMVNKIYRNETYGKFRTLEEQNRFHEEMHHKPHDHTPDLCICHSLGTYAERTCKGECHVR